MPGHTEAGTTLTAAAGSGSMKIRSHLLLFAAVSALPVLVFSIALTVAFWQQQRAAIDRGFLERVRALAIALDREHVGIIHSLRALAASVYLDDGDLRGFDGQARRVLRELPSWASIVLTDRSGQVLVDLRRPFGAALPSMGDRPYFRQVIAEVQPVVSPLQHDPLTDEYAIDVGIPVVREGRVRYALFAVVLQPTWLRLMASYPVTPDATLTLLDQERIVVARTLNNERWVGQRPSAVLYEEAARTVEGAYRNTGLEGQPFYTAHSRAQVSGWTVATGVPAAGVEAALRRSTLILTAGAVLAVLLGVGSALAFGRRIAGPVAALAGQAASLGRGQPMSEAPPSSRVGEVDEVAAALQTASAMIRSREAELAALLGREQAARAGAESANRAKDQFLAVLSHELRTPINAVYGWARMLQSGQLEGDAAARALDAIVRNSNAQVQLIDDLLDVSRIITGKMRLDVRQADLGAVLDAALDAVRPAADAKGVRLQSVLDPRAGPIVGDPARLQQVAWNLLMNAVKFTPKGGRVQLLLQRIGSHVEIVVSDTGQGIAPDVLPHVFERFTQGDSGTTRAHGGLGLGLALVRHLVELHGGTALARSAGEGKGATFTVSLPVSIVPAGEPATGRAHPTVSEAPVPHDAVSIEGVRVLVVDDDRDARDLVSAILAGAGAEVQAAASALEAFEMFGRWRPDVLLCDIGMPEEDGHSLIRRIRALDPALGGKTPAVALTAYGRVEDRVRSISGGFDMHIPKPVDPTELTTVVAGLARR